MKKRIQWIYLILSTIFFTGFILLSFQQDNHFDYTAFNSAAKEIQHQFKSFLKPLRNDVIQLNHTIPELADCNRITPLLQAFSFTHPYVSAIAFIDSNHRYCSSTPDLPTTSQPQAQVFISGPHDSSFLSEQYYTISYIIENRRYELYVLASVLHDALQSKNPLIDNVLVFNTGQSTPVINLKNRINPATAPQEQMLNWQHQVKFSLNEEHNLRGQIYSNPAQSLKMFWYYEILQIGIFLMLIITLYFLLQKLIVKRFSMLSSLRYALRNGQFFPVYQPLYDWRKNQYKGVEVLLRWRDKKDNIIMPDTFIEEAERSGLIEPITQILIHQGCKDLKHWLQKDRQRHLAFNISRVHLNDAKLLDYLKSQCKKYDIYLSQVMLELTEREVIDGENETITHRLLELREAGFSLAIDDFGTGNASFNYLNHLPINFLKIDQMYTHAIGTESMPATLIEPIIILAKRLNLGIIAEGVETSEQAQYLQKQQVDLLQGWLYARALSADELMVLDSKEK